MTTGEIIRYNSLRFMADLVIDVPDRFYRDAGVFVHTGANGKHPEPISISSIHAASRIFVKTDLLIQALPLLKAIPCPFHLLTGSSDLPAAKCEDFARELRESTKICSWVGSNLQEYFHWMMGVPIGLAERGREGFQPEFLSFPAFSERKSIDILVTYMGNTNAIRSSLYADLGKLSSSRVTLISNRQPITEYYRAMRSAFYTVCLPGNGYDTIRTYEAILCGSIPLVYKTPIWRLHRKIGCLIFESLEELTRVPPVGVLEPLNGKFVRLDYWQKLILQHQISNFRR